MKTTYKSYWDIEDYNSSSVPEYRELIRSFKENDTETAVFHPDDPTTDFLYEIYQGKGWNVVNDPFIDQNTVAEVICTHKRIICLGHGNHWGLFGAEEMIVNDSITPLLQEKDVIFIWCNADQFVLKHGLSGFYTGMFLSECTEADLFGIPYDDELQIEMSNDWFASILGKHINSNNILKNVRQEYHDPDDPIVSFNRDRLYSNI